MVIFPNTLAHSFTDLCLSLSHGTIRINVYEMLMDIHKLS